ncbi:eukaryotic initiation factor 4f subunit p130 [Lentinula edodes]|uniref:Eukaryotic initiation factor 4f subunit p130 n=1 Tax=Lentinula edodes TaxID=5353 RepID=A0A1Q3ETG2_LENED|nr:eukaryotic initiation factor 4f subunit p130 [Lentinula edodes]
MPGSAWLNNNANPFVPRPTSMIVIKSADGSEVNLENLKKAKEEAERIAKQEAERKAKEEEEERQTLKAEEEEKARIAEEERLQHEILKAEKQRQKEEEQARLLKEEEDAAAKAEAEEEEEGEVIRINTARPSEPLPKRRPGPLDLSTVAVKTNLPPPIPSALATARIIEDLGRISYPEGVQSPKVKLNVNAKDGNFR